MDAKADSADRNATAEVSLVRGGPFFRVQQALGLIRLKRWNLGRRVGLLLAVGWLPLFVITALLNPYGLLSLIREYRLHARMLLAVPALLVGEVLMELRFRAVMTHIREAGLLDAAGLAHIDEVIAKLIRIRDSILPEMFIVILLVGHTVTSYRGLVDATAWLGHLSVGEVHLTAAGWYAIVVSTSIFQFLLGLAIWKWLLWTYFAFKLSKCKLKLMATHPDEHAGLGFLGLTSSAFAPIAFSATAVIAATWRNEMLLKGAHLLDFKLPAIVLIVFITLVALGPLAFFAPRLAEVRRRGILEYGILAQLHSTEFHEKWILHRAGHETEFLETSDSSSLADFGTAYEKIERMNALLIDKGSLYTLGAAIVIPALPMILAQVPLGVLISDLLKALR